MAWLLAALILVAFLLRVQGWYRFEVPDEGTLNAMSWSLHADPLPVGMPLIPAYPPFFPYLNFIVSFLYFWFLGFSGFVQFSYLFLHSPFGHQFTLQAGRLLIALMGALQVWITWRIGRKFISARAGFLAAALIAVNPFLVFNSHIFKSDIPLALLLTIFLYFLLAFAEKPRRLRLLFWCTFFFGLSISAKFNSAVEIFLFIPLAFLIRKEWKGMWRRWIPIALAGGFLGFFILAPNWFFHPLENAGGAMKLVSNMYSNYLFYDQPSNSYFRYCKDFFESFGVFLIPVFLFGFIRLWFRRRNSDRLIAFYFIIYFLFQGMSSFYGTRMVLPLYTAMALIIASAAEYDLFPLFRRRKSIRALIHGVLWGAVIWTCGTLLLGNLRTFNLLKTTMQMDSALTYRRHHLAGDYLWAREGFTPVLPGDAGDWDMTGIPLTYFRRHRSFQFLNTGLLTGYLLKKTDNKEKRREVEERLYEYRPFHRIHKTVFSPWDGDILFWYRPHPDFRRPVPLRPPGGLPRLFHEPGENSSTLFLPIQPYEQNTAWGGLGKGEYGRWLYAGMRMKNLILFLFTPENGARIEVRINDRILMHADVSAGAVRRFDLKAPPPMPLHDDPLYRLEIRSLSGRQEVYLVYFPVLEGGRSPVFHLEDPGPLVQPEEEAGPIPLLFSGPRPPAWVRRFHRRTGIDLSLLKQVNRRVLFSNPGGSVQPWDSGFFPATAGTYKLEIEWEPVFSEAPAAASPVFEIRSITSGGVIKSSLPWDPSSMASVSFDVPAGEAPGFIRITCADALEKNVLFREISLSPDFRKLLTQK